MLPENWRPTMTGHSHRYTKLALTMLCVGALGACKPSDRATDTAAARTDSAAGRLDSAGTAAGNTMTDSAHRNMASNNAGSWTNDRIFGFTHNADNGEIALGKLASTKATNPQVKAFARQMVTDHQAMMSEAHALMGKVNAKVDSTWDDAKSLADNGRDKLKELTDKEKGADWDKNYIESQVDMHQKVLDKLTDASKSSTDSTVAKTLVKASGKVQEHLTKAQALKSQLDNAKS
jgi:predicted outer membrane protein